jgi:hypothetical protein
MAFASARDIREGKRQTLLSLAGCRSKFGSNHHFGQECHLVNRAVYKHRRSAALVAGSRRLIAAWVPANYATRTRHVVTLTMPAIMVPPSVVIKGGMDGWPFAESFSWSAAKQLVNAIFVIIDSELSQLHNGNTRLECFLWTTAAARARRAAYGQRGGPDLEIR